MSIRGVVSPHHQPPVLLRRLSQRLRSKLAPEGMFNCTWTRLDPAGSVKECSLHWPADTGPVKVSTLGVAVGVGVGGIQPGGAGVAVGLGVTVRVGVGVRLGVGVRVPVAVAVGLRHWPLLHPY